MNAEPTPEGKLKDLLSEREREVFDLAIEGLTDQQIAQRLNIRPSTVNSYWVRIRGKLGQLSRTELVSKALRSTAESELSRVLARCAELEQSIDEQMQSSRELMEARMFRAAFEASPEPTAIIDDSGTILFANDAFSVMLRATESSVVGKQFHAFFASQYRDEVAAVLRLHRTDGRPVKAGVDHVIYGMREDGALFRVLILMGSKSTQEGAVTVCIVRPFVEEVETLRRHTSAFSASLEDVT